MLLEGTNEVSGDTILFSFLDEEFGDPNSIYVYIFLFCWSAPSKRVVISSTQSFMQFIKGFNQFIKSVCYVGYVITKDVTRIEESQTWVFELIG